MPRRARSSAPTACFHVTNRSARRIPIFLRANDYRAFVNILNEGLKRDPVRLISYCLMPNHWHLLMGPVDPRPLAKLMHWVTVTHAVRWHHYRKTVGLGPVYQNRYWSEALVEPDDLVRVSRYIERNALKAGLVRRAQDWPWGSLGDRLRPHPRLPIVSTPFLTSEAWINYVNAPGCHDEAPNRVFHNSKPVPLRVENSGDAADHPGGLA